MQHLFLHLNPFHSGRIHLEGKCVMSFSLHTNGTWRAPEAGPAHSTCSDTSPAWWLTPLHALNQQGPQFWATAGQLLIPHSKLFHSYLPKIISCTNAFHCKHWLVTHDLQGLLISVFGGIGVLLKLIVLAYLPQESWSQVSFCLLCK